MRSMTAFTTSPPASRRAPIAVWGLHPACETMVRTSAGSSPAETASLSTADGSGRGVAALVEVTFPCWGAQDSRR